MNEEEDRLWEAFNNTLYRAHFVDVSYRKEDPISITVTPGLLPDMSLPSGFMMCRRMYGMVLENHFDMEFSVEEYEMDKAKHMNSLTEWCKSLPSYDDISKNLRVNLYR